MKISNSWDIYEDSEINPLLYEIEIDKYFADKNYGNNDVKIFFVINCLLAHIKERRPRYVTKDKTLYLDIMLDYNKVKQASLDQKKIMIANDVIRMFDVLDKYKKLNLNKDLMQEDAKKHFIQLGWLKK